jgi:hypothetical protein
MEDFMVEEAIFKFLEKEGLITKQEMYKAIEYLYKNYASSCKNEKQRNSY